MRTYLAGAGVALLSAAALGWAFRSNPDKLDATERQTTLPLQQKSAQPVEEAPDRAAETAQAKVNTVMSIQAELRQASLGAEVSEEEREAMKARINQLELHRQVLQARHKTADVVKRTSTE